MIEIIDRRDLDDSETATTSMIELIDRQDQGAPVIKMTPVRTRPTAHRDPGDRGTGTNLTAVDLIARQDPSVFETQMISMRIRPTDHHRDDFDQWHQQYQQHQQHLLHSQNPLQQAKKSTKID